MVALDDAILPAQSVLLNSSHAVWPSTPRLFTCCAGDEGNASAKACGAGLALVPRCRIDSLVWSSRHSNRRFEQRCSMFEAPDYSEEVSSYQATRWMEGGLVGPMQPVNLSLLRRMPTKSEPIKK
jgi:hypothetical protein